MMSTLEELLDNEIPTGRQALIDSHNNLPQVASYCEENYEKAANKRAALEETQKYVTQSLASVAYQINTLATSMLNMLDLQATQLSNMETNINHIAQTVSIHKEKVARREIGVLTTSKSCPRTHKIVAPSNPEKQQKYKSTAIDYSILDDLGHGTKVSSSSGKSSKRSDSISSGTSTIGSGDFPVKLGRNHSQMGNYDSMSRRRPINAPPPAPLPPGNYVSSRNDSQSSLQGSSQHSPGIPQQHDRPPSQVSGMGAPPPTMGAPPPTMGAPPPPSMTGMNPANVPPPPPSATQGPGIHIGTPPPPPAPPAVQPPYVEPPPVPEDLPPPAAQPPFAAQLSHTLQQRGGEVPSPAMDLPPPPEDYDQSGIASPQYDAAMPPPPEFLQAEEPSWVPADYVEKVIAIFDYEATRDDELTFPEGSIIYVLQKNPDGWFEGVMDGYTGLFPGNYVELCP